jgi:adenine C2-methylase RlmN of 23S rRNA A2503 and tRNA A37
MSKKQIIGYTFNEIETLVTDLGFKPIFAKPICISIYKKQISSFLDIKDIPIDLRRKLDSDFEVINLQPSIITRYSACPQAW